MKYMYVRKRIGKTAVIGTVMLSMILAAGQTAGAQEVSPETAAEQTAEAAGSSAEEDAVTEGVYEDSSDGGHAIEADGVKASYSGISVK